jgi:hypothetical protein
MDPGRGCPAQIPDRGQYVRSSHRSEVEEVGSSHMGPREHTEHIDETGAGRAEGEGEIMPARSSNIPHNRERSALQKMSLDQGLSLSELHPAGKSTIAAMQPRAGSRSKSSPAEARGISSHLQDMRH